MRLFLGVRPDDRILKEILSHQQALRENLAGLKSNLRYVTPESFHLTLHFLGDIGFQSVGPLTTTLKAVATQFSPIQQTFDQWSFFPSAAKGAVIAMSGATATKELSDLHHLIKVRLMEMGFPLEDRPYIPHFTVARTREPVDFRKISAPAFAPFLFEFRRFQLFQSHLTAEGSQYQVLREIDLADPLTT